jgi:hypothetical protein
VTSTSCILILQLQPFQNDVHSNFWDGCKTCTRQCGTMRFCMILDFQRMNNFNKIIFVRNKKYEHGGRLKVKIHILFYRGNSWIVALRQMKFGTVKDHGHAEILISCWDKCWNTMCRILYFSKAACLCKLFNLINLIQHFCNWNDSGIILKPPISFHGGQKYVEVHLWQHPIACTLYYGRCFEY